MLLWFSIRNFVSISANKMKKSTLLLRFIKLNDFGFHLVVKARINNKKANLLIDSGASNTVFDKTLIGDFLPKETLHLHEKLSTGLGTNSMKSESAVIQKLELGKLVIQSYQAVILDLSHVNASYKAMKLKPIEGVLGGDILKKYNAVINYKKKTLVLTIPSLLRKNKKAVKKKKSN
jgi:hypothetical protein